MNASTSHCPAHRLHAWTFDLNQGALVDTIVQAVGLDAGGAAIPLR